MAETSTTLWQLQKTDRTADLPRPQLTIAALPVLMSDAITPVGGETLLSLILKNWDQRKDQ